MTREAGAQARPADDDAAEHAGSPGSADAVSGDALSADASFADASSDGPPADAPEATAGEGERPGAGRPERRPRGAGRRRGTGSPRGRLRFSLPLLPVLSALLVLLLAGVAFLWLTRPEASAVRTESYVQALTAAKSGVVDVTSFDYLTLDDDIEQIRRVTTGDLRQESVAQLDGRRQELTDAKAVVNTKVVGAGVTRADDSAATVLLLIQSTQQTAASPQAQVVKYRIQVEMTKTKGRWLLSGISGR